MRHIIKHPVVIGLLIVWAVFIGCWVVATTCTHRVTRVGTVISHNVTSSRYGDITYYTVARFDDGYIRSLEGLKYYVIQVGGKIYYKDIEWN